MRRFVFTIGLSGLTVLAAASSSLAEDRTAVLQACRSYSNLAYRTVEARDQGQTEQDQLTLWQNIPASDPKRSYYIARAKTMLDYVYNTKGEQFTPISARSAFFRGCRVANQANIAPPPSTEAAVILSPPANIDALNAAAAANHPTTAQSQ